MRCRAVLLAALAVAFAPACKKNRGGDHADKTDESGEQQGPDVTDGAAGTSKAPDGPTGTISGTIRLTGTPPEMPVLQRGSDSFCAQKEMRAETVVVGEGGALANTLVRVAPGAVPGWVPDTTVVVDQRDCMYRPRVQGAVRGQKLQVKNSDGTMHNVNARRLPWGERRDTETLFNRGQPKGSAPLEGKIRDADIMKLKCDSHGWMQGYVVVGDNPYHATSGADGHFAIDKAPVGTYEVQAWHEMYGIKTAKVTVEEGKTATVDFTYDVEKDKPASAGGGGGGAAVPTEAAP
jgi:hypothetical protein